MSRVVLLFNNKKSGILNYFTTVLYRLQARRRKNALLKRKNASVGRFLRGKRGLIPSLAFDNVYVCEAFYTYEYYKHEYKERE